MATSQGHLTAPVGAAAAAATRCRHLAIASYVLIKLMHGCALGSMARYALLTTLGASDVKAFRLLVAGVGLVKLAHMALTAAAITWLLTPKRLAALTAATLACFLTAVASVTWRARLASSGEGPLVDAPLTVLATVLAVLLQTVDASMDAAFWQQKP